MSSPRDFQQLKTALAVTVRRKRHALGMSQEQLALSANLDRSYVSQIERGISNPSLAVMADLAGQLQCDLVDLLVPKSEGD
ncbi:helix-turn-helix domain-containing protein [Silvimonas soli]|uniref:helix-turn-helix domain-containing protein n=1 Tax=Silvimonas soli TaxID=2980100 RepID=UPI0024B38953|nr:helix-turn-helix transcriptional regulator [Silvimonas soli]